MKKDGKNINSDTINKIILNFKKLIRKRYMRSLKCSSSNNISKFRRIIITVFRTNCGRIKVGNLLGERTDC